MTDHASDQVTGQEAELAGLDDVTLAVRGFINASQDLTARMARRMEMNVSDMTAILLLSERGAMGVTELARRLGVSSPAITVLVDRLQRAGHLERVRDTVDRRRVQVTETPAAREAALHAWLPAIREIDQVCRSLSAADQVVARRLLDRLNDAMTRS